MTTINKIKIAESFMDIMEEYMKRQDEDPNFDGHHELYDLYESIQNLYFQNT